MLSRLFGLVLAGGLLLASEGGAQLPPDIEAERFLLEAERHIGTGDHAAAKAALDRILDLQSAHDLELPEAFWFQYAEVAYQAGLHVAAEEAATRYLTTVGRAGAHYRAALALLDRVEAASQRVEAERQRRAEELRRAAAAAEAERRRLEQFTLPCSRSGGSSVGTPAGRRGARPYRDRPTAPHATVGRPPAPRL